MQKINTHSNHILDGFFTTRGSHDALRVISWVLPLSLFTLAVGLEFVEETYLEEFVWFQNTHFLIEGFIFGVLGPVAVFIVLTYIRRLLSKELQLRSELEGLNQGLETKVAERTAMLAERNQQLDSANQQLKHLDEMKSEFVSLVSHELRAPLTTLNGGLEIALQSADSLPAASRRTLEAMVDESARLTQFVQTILDVSRMEAGRFTLNLGAVAIAPIIHRSVEVILGTRRQVLWDLPSEIPPVWADEVHYEQILRNLLRNADKYSPAEQPIEIKVQVGKGMISLEVSDHGAGILPEMQGKIFERFQRGQSGESAPPGWGLGLYFAKKLTEAQSGTLLLRSPVWHELDAPGSTFIITMPVAANAPDEIENA
jgi:signal transduction histidine kinase